MTGHNNNRSSLMNETEALIKDTEDLFNVTQDDEDPFYYSYGYYDDDGMEEVPSG